MLRFILDLATAVRVFFTCRTDLALEILALRQRVAVLKTQAPPQAEPDGSIVLDSVTQCLVPLGRGLADREAGDGGELASRGISVVLALAVSRTSPW